MLERDVEAMPLTRSIDETTGLVLLTAEGRITIGDIQAELVAAMQAPEFRPGVDMCWNLRAADGLAPSVQELRALVDFVASQKERRGTGYRVAVVVARDLDFGLARMYGMYAAGLPFELSVFRSMREAELWLASDAPHAD